MKSIHLAFCLLLFFPTSAWCHWASSSELNLDLSGDHPELRIEIPLRDLDLVLNLDSDGDRRLRWGELLAHQTQIERYLQQGLQLSVDGRRCALQAGSPQVDDVVGEPSLWLLMQGQCTTPRKTLNLAYSLLFDQDPTHRALVVTHTVDATHSTVLSPAEPDLQWKVEGGTAISDFLRFLRSGMHHIWVGSDHLLFLITLLMPGVLTASGQRARASEALRNTFLVVTAFTLSHSLTLGLAALGLINLPGRLVEIAIAASVLVAAVNNITGWLGRRHALLALIFGLVHGLGFANVITELSGDLSSQLLSLAGFNLGVELGQLAVVAVAMPLLYALAYSTSYARRLLPAGSLAVCIISAWWIVQRTA